jgi:hypothetical protein
MSRGIDTRTPVQLQRELRNCRKAIRMLKRAEWMVTCDWTSNEERDELWATVRKLSKTRV